MDIFQVTIKLCILELELGCLIGVPGENYRPVAFHAQTLSHNVVSSTPRHERELNSQR
jgi:hypothetical protein